MPKHAGNDGGTVVVIKSSDLTRISFIVKPAFIKNGTDIPKPTKDKHAISIMYFTESLWNFESPCFGYNIERMRLPLAVLNPVEYTNARHFSLLLLRFCITVVPANKNFFFSFSISNISSIRGMLLLIIGVDSPVNIASLIITVPFSKTQSHGIARPSSCISNKSPGTNSVLCIRVISRSPLAFLR